MKPGPNPADIESVLVVKPSSLGDIVHTLPSVHLLKAAWPHLKISWVVNTEWSPLLEGNADLEQVILFPRREMRGIPHPGMLRGWFRKLGLIKPDLALDFQGLLRSALLARISGARAIHCLGDADPTCRILAHRVVPAVRSEEHAVTRYLKLVQDLGVDGNGALEYPLAQGTRPQADLPENYLLMHPFSRGENKSIPAGCLARLCELLAPAPIVLVGRSEGGFAAPEGCVNLLNKTTIQELIWLIRNARFTVSVDSGPMHIAAAITERVLGIHNWTSPFLVGPYRPDAWVWKNGQFMQMREIGKETARQGRNFGPGDVEAVADFLKARMDGRN